MINSKGDRKYSKYINFNKKFKNKPNVIVSLKGIDAANDKYIEIYQIMDLIWNVLLGMK